MFGRSEKESRSVFAVKGCEVHLGGLRRAGLGWLTGFEPATARSTIWSSNQSELQPPRW